MNNKWRRKIYTIDSHIIWWRYVEPSVHKSAMIGLDMEFSTLILAGREGRSLFCEVWGDWLVTAGTCSGSITKLLDIDSCRSAWSTGLVSIEIEIRSLMIQAREGWFADKNTTLLSTEYIFLLDWWLLQTIQYNTHGSRHSKHCITQYMGQWDSNTTDLNIFLTLAGHHFCVQNASWVRRWKVNWPSLLIVLKGKASNIKQKYFGLTFLSCFLFWSLA